MSAFEHLMVIVLLVSLIIVCLHNRKSQQRYKEVVTIRDAALDISNHMMEIETTDEGFQYILEKCIELFEEASLGSILLVDEEGFLRAHAHYGFSENHIKNFKIPFSESFIFEKTGGRLDQVAIINDLNAKLKPSDTVETFRKGVNIQSQLTAPLLEGDKLIGIVCIDSLKNHTFTDNDKVLLEYMMKHINRITLQQTLRESVIYHSRHDYLTHLYNRSYFDLTIDKQLKASQSPFVLCAIDLDGLKNINDVYGHLTGDELIRRFGLGVLETIKGNEYAARYGGDEFTICFFEEELQVVVDRLTTLEDILYQNGFSKNNTFIVPRFSYGLVQYPEEGLLLDVLLSKADNRMYQQKNKKEHRRTI
jgi:diguanylate cyclase (GGDEF)-like protein